MTPLVAAAVLAAAITHASWNAIAHAKSRWSSSGATSATARQVSSVTSRRVTGRPVRSV
ncbi:hypothetical protein ACFWBV_01910 [Streptomyces sp. NPDC060030]|uniref:hypothetical protein n=1 Tax=Streptomyces sp. NPDC060030 TaxID=3347042 RepID=UPI0036A4FC39